eukprot:g2383.t1
MDDDFGADDPFGAEIPDGEGDDDMFGEIEADAGDAAAMDEFLNDGVDNVDDGANEEDNAFGDATMPESNPEEPWTEEQPEAANVPEPEPEPVVPEVASAMVEWRQKWRKMCEEKDEMDRKAKEKRQADAREALQKFYEQRESHKEKMHANNRAEESDLMNKQAAEKESGNPWERIVSLIDTKEDAEKDVSRMKEMMIQLKHSPNKTS